MDRGSVGRTAPGRTARDPWFHSGTGGRSGARARMATRRTHRAGQPRHALHRPPPPHPPLPLADPDGRGPARVPAAQLDRPHPHTPPKPTTPRPAGGVSLTARDTGGTPPAPGRNAVVGPHALSSART